MGVLKQRRKPLAIRKVKDSMEYANQECEKEINKMDDSDELCTCPNCESKEHVSYTGTNRGRRKFKCSNPSNEDCGYFSTSTSLEAMNIYQEVMVDNLATLLGANSVINGIRKINCTSKHLVELPLERLYEYISQEASEDKISIKENTDIVTIFSDLSGSGLAKNKAIILAMVDDVPIFEVVTTDNYLSTNNLLAAIKQRLDVPDDTQIVFVTDGERSFVGPIKRYFPDAVHIRQFHKKTCRGIIYVHLKYDDQEYTIRCLWNLVLDEGEASEDTLKKRKQRAKQRKRKDKGKKRVQYTDLSKDVMIWEGTVYNPRGKRRKKSDSNKKEEDNDKSEEKNTSPHDTTKKKSTKEIFKGQLKDAKEIPVFDYSFKIMKEIFGGLYITSNVAENVFNVKSKLEEHRTMKFGERILVCILYGELILKDMNYEELIDFLKDEVITLDFIRNKTLAGSGLQKNEQDKTPHETIIKDSIENDWKLSIHYRDRNRNHTSRVISPLELNRNSYDDVVRVKAHCHLRDAERTFLLSRIRDLSIFDPDPFCLT